MDISFGDYGQERDLICTEEERQIYNNLYAFLKDNEIDVTPLRFVRVSQNYVTAKYGEWDLARIKFTQRAKWLNFPEADSEKHKITSPDELTDYADMILHSIKQISKFL